MNDRFCLLESGQVGDVAALKSTTEDLKQMLLEVEDALKEREEEVEMRREKNDEYNKLKKDVDGQLEKLESGKRDSYALEIKKVWRWGRKTKGQKKRRKRKFGEDITFDSTKS